MQIDIPTPKMCCDEKFNPMKEEQEAQKLYNFA